MLALDKFITSILNPKKQLGGLSHKKVYIVKVKCGDVVGNDFSMLADFAREQTGALVFASSKKAYTNIPIQAELEAIYWTLNMAKEQSLDSVRSQIIAQTQKE